MWGILFIISWQDKIYFFALLIQFWFLLFWLTVIIICIFILILIIITIDFIVLLLLLYFIFVIVIIIVLSIISVIYFVLRVTCVGLFSHYRLYHHCHHHNHFSFFNTTSHWGEFSNWIREAWSTPTHWLLWVSHRVSIIFIFIFFVSYSLVTTVEVLTPSFIFIIWNHLIMMPRGQGM